MVTASLKELQFHQKLTGNTPDLLKKLKDLQAELKELEQETVDTKSLSSVTKQLIDTSIIVFGLFVNELRHIANASSTYFSMYYYLLESLSVVKSIVLITDLKNADELMTNLFRNIFDDIRPQQAKNVQICMSELLQHIIDESTQLPQEIVDIILAQFLHRHKFDNPAAYRLACDLGNNCAEKLQRYVFQYFSDIISVVGNGELSSKELDDFRIVHKLVIELNKATPALLLNVIPQLEEELKARLSDVTIRTLATKSLGDMFSEKTSQLTTQYESTWKAWLQRRNDKIPQVRIVWIESLVNLIKSHASLSKELSEGLAEKLIDPDEKVRAVACRTIGEFDYETSLHHIQKNTLIQVGHRCRDKKKSVSKEAINTLSVLYNQAYPEIENGTQASISHFGWMPSAILHAVYVNDNEVFSFVDHAIFTTLFPPHGSAASRTQRILTTFAALDDKGRTGFLSVLRRSVDTRSHMTAFLKLLESQKNNDATEDFEKKLGAIVKVIGDRLPDPVKSSLLLYKYAKLHDSTFLQLISDCMDSRKSLKEIRTAAKETTARIENVAPATLEVFIVLIQRISLTLINSEIVSELIKNIARSDEHRQISGELLRSISPIFPAIFIDHLTEITGLLHDSTFAGASDALQTLAEFAKQFPKSVPADNKAKETLRNFLTSGTVAQATDAIIVLASIANNDSMCEDIAETCSENLDVSSPDLLKNLTILSQITLYSPQVFESVSGDVVAFIMKKLLLTNTPEQETRYDITEDWVEKSELDQYSLSKIMGLKVLVNRAIVLLESDPEAAQSAVRPVFQLLWALIAQEGELVAEKNTNAVMKSHLRLNAARFVIKLTRGRPPYEKMVAVADYCRLSLVIQDPVYRVRHGLASRIMKYLRAKELHIRYLAVMLLAAHEPELEWKSQVQKFLSQQSKSQAVDSSLMLNEQTLARLLHLLSNHPDFVIKVPEDDDVFGGAQLTHSVQDLNLAARYIEFYLDTMANSENISLVFHIASLMKTVRFVNANEATNNLYVLSDLAQYLIQERSRSHGWTLTSYPGQVKLPRELFLPLAQNEVSVEISKRIYLPSAWVQAREHKTDRKPKLSIERKMGQASKRRSRSPSPHDAEDMEDIVIEKGAPSPSRAKRPKKAKVADRIPEEPTRRMASRAAKTKATVYKDVDNSEGDSDEMESEPDSS
ncbi:hypothetical protein EC991_011471 [Linnemannia zychae]|nr:hypothetical protein EC991_011471 [Linnemannia zychae]